MLANLGSLIPLGDLVVGWRLLWRLPGFLRHPIDPEEARRILHRRLQRRKADFLALLRRAVYGNPSSSYRQLLQMAGCEYGDVELVVRREGVEAALRALYQNGVCLTVDEFKGRRPVVRGSATITVEPHQLRSPGWTAHLLTQTSGSRQDSTAVPIALSAIRDRSVNICLSFEARGGRDWLHAVWGVPGYSATRVLEWSGFGALPVRWFSQVDPSTPGLSPRYRWSGRALRWGSLLAGVPLPRSEYVPLDDPLPIARWMATVLRAGRTPHLNTFSSPAVRLCQAALEAGLDIRGARFMLTGEPITAARLAVIRQTGAEAWPTYGSTECTPLGHGCLRPEASDDIHLFHDLYSLIQAGGEGGNDLPPKSLLVSSLRPTAPLILLNVSLGDQAALVQRACGCPLEALGWATHLHTIRSFEKLTAGGMAFLDTDVIRVLDEVLPARFGGAPSHYQLLEEEGDDGRPSLRLLVHPAVGPLQSERVVDAFLTAIGTGAGAERVMELQWRQAGLLKVERRAPLAGRTGKILHLHQQRRGASD